MTASRRTFLFGLGSGVIAAVAWSTWRQGKGAAGVHGDAYPIPAYVDYGGWIVTKADKDKLTATGSIKKLEGMTLDGRALRDDVVADEDSCVVWCLGEPECQGFTFAKADRKCELKATSDLRPSPNPAYVSGVR